MASISPRRGTTGAVTSYLVRWREGGARTDPFASERFDDLAAAEIFRDAVNDSGQHWPPGWVKGKGYIDQAAADTTDAQYVFEAYALESIKHRTGVEDHYRDAIEKELRTYLLPTFGNCDVRSTAHFSKATVSAWVNQMAKTKVWRGSVHKEMSPKTLRNLHGLLSSILREAMQEEPPLRARNPCELTRLPRTDDDGVDDEDGEVQSGAEWRIDFKTRTDLADRLAGFISAEHSYDTPEIVGVPVTTGSAAYLDWINAETRG